MPRIEKAARSEEGARRQRVPPANSNRRTKRGKDEREFLPAALEILETPASPAARGVALTLAVFFTIAVIWAIFGEIDIVAVANGKIVPTTGVKFVQPLEIGVVRAIHVRDGQSVKAGAPLIDLDPTESEVDKDQVSRELIVAQVEASRIEATLRAITGDPPVFRPPLMADSRLVRMNRDRLSSELLAIAARMGTIESELSRRMADRQAIRAEIAKLKGTIPLVAQRDEALERLVQRGNAPRREWLAVRQAHIEQRQDLEIQRHRFEEVEAAMQTLRKQKEQERADTRRQLIADLMQARDKADAAALALRKMARREQRHRLVSPVDGVVQQLQVHTVGGVVTPAQTLMVVVPRAAPIEVEVLVLNRDKGFVEAGQRAEIKIESFPFTKYGTIGGKVLYLSGDAIQHEKLGPVYAARVSMARTDIAADGRRVALVPGMAATVEIKTGKRRVIEFLMAPLLRYQKEALHER